MTTETTTRKIQTHDHPDGRVTVTIMTALESPWKAMMGSDKLNCPLCGGKFKDGERVLSVRYSDSNDKPSEGYICITHNQCWKIA